MKKQSATRRSGSSRTAIAAKLLGAVWLATTLGCHGAGQDGQPTPLDETSSSGATHKVQLSAASAAKLEKQGAKVVGDYGAFKVLEVNESVASTLPQDAEIRDDYNEILLNTGTLDTSSAHGKSLRALTAPVGKGFHIVQFAGPVRPEWYQALVATGVRVVTYIPNNAYIVYGDAPTLSGLQKHVSRVGSGIQWNGDYLADYKLHPSIQSSDAKVYSIQLVKDASENALTLNLLRQLQYREPVVQESQDYVNVVAYVNREAVYELVSRPDVFSVNPRAARRKFDERQNMIVSGHLNGTNPTGPGYLAWLASKGFTQEQFTASGFGVDVSDSGLDNGTTTPNHFGLYLGGDITSTSRVVYSRLEGTPNSGSTIQGCDGHGTLNTHIIAGYSNRTGAPFADAAGYDYGLGVAPFVKVGASVVFDPDWTDADYEDLQSRAYRDGMRISSNSWGADENIYDADAQRYDTLVRDAQPTGAAVAAPGNQEMVIVFAAGNAGPDTKTMGTPGTAKNVITVGASENVQSFGGEDGCKTPDSEADSALDMVGFSSRGPTTDGRKKPDIVAPGTHVSGGVAQSAEQRANPPAFPNGKALSCFIAIGDGVCGGPSNSQFFPTTQQWYSASSGTSHSTPAVAGGAALVRQYFINQGIAPPSAAMTKAYLMNSARYLTGTDANDDLYSNNQGMGMMDLGMAFDGVARKLADQTPEDLFTATGQTRVFTGAVKDSSKPFRVTLAWTDAPGSTTGSAWKNNLNLTVDVAGKSYKGNVFAKGDSVTGGTADDKNNVESVFLPAGVSGAFTVTVTAANINSNGVPNNTPALDQDFALIVYNSCNDTSAQPTSMTASVGGDNVINLAWAANDATAYNVYRATTAGGPYTRIATTTSAAYSDTSVSGGTQYFYVVRGVVCAESAASDEVSATATGLCTLQPDFDGLTSATSAGASVCADTLSWSAGTPHCDGTLSYSVYRSTTAGFAPSEDTRIATGLTATTFADDAQLTSGTRYYYVVRATETAGAAVEEKNTVEKSATPYGASLPGLRYGDDFDSNRPANAAAYWIATAQTGNANTLNIVTNCHYQSATKSYRFGAATANCGGTYPINTATTLALGGNGTTAGINGFAIPAGTTAATLSFNVWYKFENLWDGAYLTYSTTGASGPWTNVPDTVTANAPYITAGGYDGALTSTPTTRVWTNNNAGANGALKAVSVNLNALAGQTVWFGFRFYSGSKTVAEGLYLDNVNLVADSVASCTTKPQNAGPAVGYTLSGLSGTTPVGSPATFTVKAVDALGLVATGYTGTAAITSTDTNAELPANLTFTQGVATNVAITFHTLGAQSVTATDTVNATFTATANTTVTPGATKSLTFTSTVGDAVAGTAFSPVVKVGLKDAFGNDATSSTNSVTLTLGGASGGTLSGTTTVAAVNGVATFSNLSINKVGTGYTLVASSTGLTDATSSAFNVTEGPAAKLVIRAQPSDGTASTTLSPAFQVAVVDAFDNATHGTQQVTVTLTGGTLSGTTTVTAVDGVATFSDLSIAQAGTGYTLVASSTGLADATSAAFNVAAGPATQLVIRTQPSNGTASTALSPAFQVALVDALGNTTHGTDQVSVTLTGGTLSGTTSVAAVDGVATFSDLSIAQVGTGYTLVASSNGLPSVTSESFAIAEGPAAKLVIRTQPSNGTAGSPLSPTFQVALVDAFDNATHGTQQVTVTLTGGTLSGTTSVAAVDGVATFSDLSIAKAGTGYTLVASSNGLPNATSESFAIAAAPAAKLAIRAQPSNGTAGTTLSPALQVAVVDAFDNAIVDASSITVALKGGAVGATLSGTTTVATTAGVATFGNLSIAKAGTGYTLVASTGSVPGATSSAFDIAPGAPHHVAIVQQPSTVAAGSAIAPAVSVQVLDAAGNLVTQGGTTVTVVLGNNPSSGTLSGATSVAAVNGVATFSTLSINKVGTGYTLAVGGNGLTGATTAAFDVQPGVAAQLVFEQGPAAVLATGEAFSARVAVLDAQGNKTHGTTRVTLSLVNAAGATLSGTTAANAVDGVVTFTGLSVAKAGTGYALKAEATGTAAATSSTFRVNAPAATQLAFRAAPGNIQAGATLSTLEVEVRDASGQRVTEGTVHVTLALGANAAQGSLLGTLEADSVNGVATFKTVSLRKAGTGYTLVASGTGVSSATSAAFTVAPAAPARYTVTLAATTAAGQETSFSAAAFDAYDNACTQYTGAARVTSTDAAAVLPSTVTFAAGVVTDAKVTFKTGGAQTLTLTDVAQTSLTASAQTTVSPYAAPTVAITSPTNNAKVSGSVSVIAKATTAPGTTIAKVTLFVDGTEIASGKTATVSGSWDSRGAKSGTTHTLTAVVVDSAGNTVTSAPVTVVIEAESGGCSAASGGEAGLYAGLLALAQVVALRRRRNRAA
ncbi:S8 family serine peptidase [Myxococcaceae bacterium JPH2]|nr:S8 family serine peptidase [Myxococcaceae bacterium JPH2]